METPQAPTELASVLRRHPTRGLFGSLDAELNALPSRSMILFC